MNTVAQKLGQHTAESLATVSASSAFVAWFAETLPILQWLAALAAILSGLMAAAWVGFKFYKVWKASRPIQ